jgi:hypothetical protein
MVHRQRQWLRLAALEAAILVLGLGALLLLDYALDAALEVELVAVGIERAGD